MALNVELKKIGGVHCFQFSGHIDEVSVFPEIPSDIGKVVIDLEKVAAINSVGIRSWLQWFDGFQGATFTFKNCPVPIIMQMNMVEGFLPSGSKVESFFVPYFCEDCDKEFQEKFILDRDVFVENGAYRLASDYHVQCSKGCSPELDTNEAKYFRFLTKLTEDKTSAA